MAWLSLLSTGVQAYSQAQTGRINAANSQLQSVQDKRDANQAQVEAQAQATNERRRAKILRSRALAVAGASGAGISEDPTISNILDSIGTQGEVRALDSLAAGDYLAQGLRSGAQSKRNMSGAYRAAGNLSAAGTLAGAVPSFYDRYGDGWGMGSNRGRGGSAFYAEPILSDVGVDQSLVRTPRF